MAFGSRVIGEAALRRTLRRLPDTERAALADALSAIGQRLLIRAKAETPVRTGRLRAALNVKVSAKTLQLRLGLVTKAMQRKFFYGYILDKGRRAKTVTARRKGGEPYQLRVSPIAASRYDFVFGRRRDFKTNELPAMRQAVISGLENAVRG